MMSNQAPILSHYENLLKNHSPTLGWLNQLQYNAFQHVKEQGLPTHQLEDWKYTRTTDLLNQQFELTSQATHITLDELNTLSAFSSLDAHQLVFIDGKFHAELSHLAQLPDNVIICDMDAALSQHEKAIKTHLDAQDHQKKPSQHGFTHLNAALFRFGAYVHIPSHCVLEKPIVLNFIASKHANQRLIPIRNIIHLEESSQACVLEAYTAQSSLTYFTNVITDCKLNLDAKLDHYKVSNESQNAFHIGNTLATQKANSEFNSYSLSVSGQLTRSDTYSLLQGAKSQCQFHGLFIGKNQHHIDHHTYVEHQVPNTKSNEHYKGILSDQARGVFNGRVFVSEGASGTDARQQNHNLLLSKTAEIDTKPQLEIYNDDVKCTHGATVGQLDPGSLFYLQTRGLTHAQAQHMLTLAFASDALKTAGNKAILAHLMDLIDSALPSVQEVMA